MAEINKEALLNKKEVVEEINRHRWLESEKAGYDIGFETAAEDWIKRFAVVWLQYNMPAEVKSSAKAEKAEKADKAQKPAKAKRRKAKSYFE